ncbi:hypothetical protein Tco_1546403 [Tanacetum coccineum]
MTTPSTSSTNNINTAIPAYEVSTANPNVNTPNPQVSTASFSDNVVYAFMVKNLNGSNLLQQDLEQIHEDDLEAMDLKWEYRAPRNKEGQFRNQDNTRKQGKNEDTSSKVMLAIDSVVPPPHPLIYNRPNKLDLSYSGLDEFKEPEFKGYGPKDSEQESNVVCDKKFRKF